MKRLFFILLCIAAIFALSACGDEPDLVLEADGKPAFMIVRPSDGDPEESDAAIKLMLFLKDYYSTEDITLATDRKTASEGVLEILVGATSRPESAEVKRELKKDDYAVKSVGGKLVIVGGSAEATAKAVEYFCADCTSALEKGSFSASDSYTNISEGGVDHAEAGGVPLADYVIVYPAQDSSYDKVLSKRTAELLRDAIASVTGYYLELKSDDARYAHEILCGRTARPESESLYASSPAFYETALCCTDGTVAIAPGGIWAADDLESVISSFVDGDRFVLPSGTENAFGTAPAAEEKPFVYYLKDSLPDDCPVKKMTVCGVDISKFTVVCHDPGEGTGRESELYAAKEFIKYVKYATGVELPLENDAGRYEHEILIGTVDREYPFDKDGLRADGLIIYTDDDSLYITGEGNRGTLYGVYEFLEKYVGYRFFASDCEVVYKSAGLNVPSGVNDRQESDIFYRDVYAYDALFGGFAAKRKINGYYLRSFAREEGGGETFAGGNTAFVHTVTRVFGIGDLDRQPCLTDPDNLEKAKLMLRGLLDSYPDSRIVSVSQNDNNYCCRCSACAAVNREEKSDAGTLIRFINALADDIKDDYPDVKILTLAYMYSAEPTVTPPRDNVIIELCAYDFCAGHPYGACSGNEDFIDQLSGWGEITDNVFIWDYISDATKKYAHVPFMNFDAIYENFLTYRNFAVTGYFGAGNGTKPGAEFGELRSYLISSLMWDKDITRDEYEAMICEFIDAFYGSGARAVKKYFDFIRETSRDRHFDLYSSTEELLNGTYFKEAMPELARWFNTADKLACNDPAAEALHLSRLRDSFESLYKYYKK